MLRAFKNGQTSVILRCKLLDSSSSTGAGLTGLTNSSSGLIISTIADTESSATAYTQAGSTIETITTLGTYAAPTATKCRFKEVDSTNHKGIYEFQFADARFAVAGATGLVISVSGAANLMQTDFFIQLQIDANIIQLNADATAAANIAKSARTIGRGTVGSSSSQTSVTTSSFTPLANAVDQFKGRTIIFDADTTTLSLRGQATAISGGNTSGSTPTFTVDALTTSPASGDTFSII